MRRKYVHTKSQRFAIVKQFAVTLALQERKSRLYNRKFKKSPLYISSWLVRGIYLLLFVTVAIFQNFSVSNEVEKILFSSVTIDSTKIMPDGSTKQISDRLHFTTNVQKYSISLAKPMPEMFKEDSVLVTRNLFNKPIQMVKKSTGFVYQIPINYYIAYIVILFLTLISMLFNDGLDSYTKRLLWAIMYINGIAIFMYFFLTH